MFMIMAITGLQLNVLIHTYTALLKDKDIIAAEVLHEYNDGVRLWHSFIPIASLDLA
jgi:hypothetical protein